MSSPSKALVIWSLSVDSGSCEVGDLQELNERSEFRESTEGWPVRCQWGQGTKEMGSAAKVLAIQMQGPELGSHVYE